jgi:hypothetical protein
MYEYFDYEIIGLRLDNYLYKDPTDIEPTTDYLNLAMLAMLLDLGEQIENNNRLQWEKDKAEIESTLPLKYKLKISDFGKAFKQLNYKLVGHPSTQVVLKDFIPNREEIKIDNDFEPPDMIFEIIDGDPTMGYYSYPTRLLNVYKIIGYYLPLDASENKYKIKKINHDEYELIKKKEKKRRRRKKENIVKKQ